MDKLLIDTNILIDFVFGHERKLTRYLKLLTNQQVALYINPIIEAEFLNDRNIKSTQDEQKALEFLSLFENIPIDSKQARIAGRLLRNNQSQLIPDAFVAATCLCHNLKLHTKNNEIPTGLRPRYT